MSNHPNIKSTARPSSTSPFDGSATVLTVGGPISNGSTTIRRQGNSSGNPLKHPAGNSFPLAPTDYSSQHHNAGQNHYKGNESNFGGNYDHDRSGEHEGSGLAPWKIVGGTPATWNHSELVHAILRNNEVLVAWLKEVNLLAKSWYCSKCATPMAWETVPMTGIENQDRYQWRCPRRSCGLTTQLRSGSFFDRPFFITLSSFMEIIYWWSKGAPMAFVCEETGCNMDFLCYAFCLIREVCAIVVKDFVVGGPGAVTGRSDSMKITINGMVCEGYFSSMLPAEKKWRQQYGTFAFKNILEHIAEIYDVGGCANLFAVGGSSYAPSRGNMADSRRVKGRSDSRSFNEASRRMRPRALCGTFSEGTQFTQRDEAPSPWNTPSPAEREPAGKRY